MGKKPKFDVWYMEPFASIEQVGWVEPKPSSYFADCLLREPLPRPGNLHDVKSHAYYVGPRTRAFGDSREPGRSCEIGFGNLKMIIVIGVNGSYIGKLGRAGLGQIELKRILDLTGIVMSSSPECFLGAHSQYVRRW